MPNPGLGGLEEYLNSANLPPALAQQPRANLIGRLQTLLSGLEQTNFAFPGNIQNIFNPPFVHAGNHAQSLDELFALLDFIAPDGNISNELAQKLKDAGFLTAANQPKIEESLQAIQNQRGKIYQEIVLTEDFSQNLLLALRADLSLVRKTQLAEIVKANLLASAHEAIKDSFTQAIADIDRMYSGRREVQSNRHQIAFALLSVALSIVNAAALGNFLSTLFSFDTKDSAAAIMKAIKDTYQHIGDNLSQEDLEKIKAALSKDMQGNLTADTIKDLFTRSSEVALDRKFQLLTMQLMISPIQVELASQKSYRQSLDQISSSSLQVFKDLYEQIVERGNFSKQFLQEKIRSKLSTDEASARFWQASSRENFIKGLVEELRENLLPEKIDQVDKSVALLAQSDLKIKNAILEEARRSIYINGKYYSLLPIDQAWNKLRDLKVIERSKITVVDTTGKVMTASGELKKFFPELEKFPERFWVAKSLSGKILGSRYQRNLQIHSRLGWEISSGQISDFVRRSGAASIYSLHLNDWNNLIDLSNAQLNTALYAIKTNFSANDMDKITLHTITPISILAYSETYQAALKAELAASKLDPEVKALESKLLESCSELRKEYGNQLKRISNYRNFSSYDRKIWSEQLIQMLAERLIILWQINQKEAYQELASLANQLLGFACQSQQGGEKFLADLELLCTVVSAQGQFELAHLQLEKNQSNWSREFKFEQHPHLAKIFGETLPAPEMTKTMLQRVKGLFKK